VPTVEYGCKHCRKPFAHRDDARACEKNHAGPGRAHPLTYGSVNPYPLTIEVDFPNGEKKTYIQEEEYWRR
jgi:hypothetical protein